MSLNFSFDKRVAARYDAQRAHPEAVSRQIGQTIAAQARPGARVLEIGIGTGRIAWPVAAAGCRVIGFDISPDMLAQVQAGQGNGQRPSPFPLTLLQADMHHMPFASRTFDAVLAVHVLHLAKDWQQVLSQIGRVLRPGGVLIQGEDWIDPHSVVGRLRDELRARTLALAPQARPPSAGISLQQTLHSLGGSEQSTLIAAEWTTWVSARERLAQIENRLDAESWFLPDDLFVLLLQQLRDFAAETWPDLDEQQPVTRRFVLQLTRGSWQSA